MNLKDLTDIEVVVSPTLKYDNNFSDDVEIDRSMLEEEFASQPKKFAYYGSLQAIMNKKLQDVRRERKELYAKIDKEVRDLADQEGKKLTEKMVENMVTTAPVYVKKSQEENHVSYIVDLLDVQKEAMKQRKDMLIQLGADHRQSSMDTRVYGDVYKEIKANK